MTLGSQAGEIVIAFKRHAIEKEGARVILRLLSLLNSKHVFFPFMRNRRFA
jgi:hypothetical protein